MGGKSGTTTQSVQIPPEVLARYNSVNAQAQSVAATPFQQYSSDPNAFVAPLTAAQNYGLQQTSNYANAAQPGISAAENMTQQAASGVTPQSLNTQAYMNPYEASVIAPTAALMQQQFGQAQSGALGNAVQSGAFGGDRAGIANANLQQQQGLAYGQTMGNLLNQNYSQALGAAQQQQGVNLGAQQFNAQQQLAAGNQLGNLAQAGQQSGLAGAQALMGAGQSQQQTEQAGLTALYNQFLQQQSYPFQTAQFLANIAEGTGALSGQTTSTTQPMPFFSDRRLKEDIKEIGKAKNGLPIYSFRYKDDPDKLTRIGFMADEVEKKHPDAVGLAGGYKTVDYDRAARAEGGLVGDLDQGETYGRGGYDDGGIVSPFNPWNQLAAREMQIESGEGGAGAASTSPYSGRGATRVPLAPFEHHALLQPAPMPHEQQGAGAQALQGLGQLEHLYDMGKSAQGMYGDVKKGLSGLGGGDSHPAPAPAAPPPANHGVQPTASPPPVSEGGAGPARETSDAGTSAAPPDSGDSAPTGLAAADVPPPDTGGGLVADLSDSLGSVLGAASGGRIGRDVGGGLMANGMPSMANAPVQAQVYDAAARQNAMPTWGGPFARGGLAAGGAPAPGFGISTPSPTAPFQGPDVVSPTQDYLQGLGEAQAAQARANQVQDAQRQSLADLGVTTTPDLTPFGRYTDASSLLGSTIAYGNLGLNAYTNPVPAGVFARGGLAGRPHRGAGGGLDVGQWNSADQEYQGGNDNSTQDTTQIGIPDEQPSIQPLKPSTPPSSGGGGGLGGIGQGIGALTGLLGLFAARGGRIGRDDGGRIFGFDPQQDVPDSTGERGARILAGYGDDGGGDPAPAPAPVPPPRGLAGRRGTEEDAAPDASDVPLPPRRPPGLGASEFSAHDPLDSVSMGEPNTTLPNDYVGRIQSIEAGGYGESAPTRPTGLHGNAIAPDARIAVMPSAADPTGDVMAGASGYAPGSPSTPGDGSLVGPRAKAGLQPDHDVPLPPRRPAGLEGLAGASEYTAANAPKGAIPGDAAAAIGKATDPSQWQGNAAPPQPNTLQQGANAIGAAGATVAHGLDEATRNVKNFFQAGTGNIDYARAYLASRGWNPGAIAGILGQLVNEGGGQLNPQAVGPGGDFGIAQWLDRKPQLIKFAQQNGWDYRRLDTQLAFLDHELRTTERPRGIALQNARNPYEAAVAGTGYERPKNYDPNNPTRSNNWAGRYAATQKYWKG